MKRFTQLAAAAGLAFAMASPSLAADLPRPAYKAPVYVAPIFSWTGFYVGINGGYGFGDGDWTGTSGTVSTKPKGALFGGTVGFNYQTGRWVWGLEGDWDATWMKDRSIGTGICAVGAGCETKVAWLATARGRIGYAWDRWMPYFTGGLAAANVKMTTGAGLTDKDTQIGWTVGLGVEYAFMGPWSAKIEYLYADLGKASCASGTCTTNTDVDAKANIVRVGINYRF
ncbi:MAG: outer membrane protein [Pseudolabrys sp.]